MVICILTFILLTFVLSWHGPRYLDPNHFSYDIKVVNPKKPNT